MKQVKRMMAVWLSLLMFASVLIAAPAGASDLDIESDLGGTLEEDLAEIPAVEELVEEVIEEAATLTEADIQAIVEEYQADLLAELPTEDSTDLLINDALEAHPSLVQPDQIVESQAEVVDGELEATLSSDESSFEISISRRLRNTRGAEVVDGERSKISDGDIDVVVESTASSIRLLEVIPQRSEAHRFEYSVAIDGEPAFLTLNDDGSVSVSDRKMVFGDEGFTLYSVIEAPWAVDSNGDMVDVSYKVSENGRVLTMVVKKARKSAYPIVADPSLTTRFGVIDCFWNCSFYLDGYATRFLRQRLSSQTDLAVARLAIGLICSALTGAAGVFAAPAGALCGLYLNAHVVSIRNNLLEASWSSRHQCLIAKFHPGRVTNTLHWRNTTTSGSKFCHVNV